MAGDGSTGGIERIGEGGMGTVYSAQQEEPVRRKVALKVIKLGMDSEQVVARFEAERQALALMNHPNIAQVYDGGLAENGRPYFAMEYVPGLPIHEFCDAHELGTRKRVELFLDVCDAIQHAHQKGIIHRDLKPSNVLVSMVDERPVPKVIDFGVARATSDSLTDQPLQTIVGQVLGTLDYMSPEQADPMALDVDTRADIYSLGVVLYELLTGVLPFDRQELSELMFSEIQEIIREKREGPAQSEHAVLAARPDLVDDRLVARDRRACAAARARGRARLDHAAGDGEGPRAAVRLRGRAGRGPATLSRRRARRRGSAQRHVPGTEVRAPQSRPGRHGPAGAARARRRPDRDVLGLAASARADRDRAARPDGRGRGPARGGGSGAHGRGRAAPARRRGDGGGRAGPRGDGLPGRAARPGEPGRGAGSRDRPADAARARERGGRGSARRAARGRGGRALAVSGCVRRGPAVRAALGPAVVGLGRDTGQPRSGRR